MSKLDRVSSNWPAAEPWNYYSLTSCRAQFVTLRNENEKRKYFIWVKCVLVLEYGWEALGSFKGKTDFFPLVLKSFLLRFLLLLLLLFAGHFGEWEHQPGLDVPLLADQRHSEGEWCADWKRPSTNNGNQRQGRHIDLFDVFIWTLSKGHYPMLY